MKCTKIKSWGKLGNLQRFKKHNKKKKKKKRSMKRKFNFREKFYLEKTGNKFGRFLNVFLTQT